MKKLDWYILRKFLSTFVFTMLTITVIAVVIDTSEKADDFVKSGLSSWEIVTHYFIGFVPFIMSMIFPLMVFIACIYFSSKMAGQSEFIAILAGGVRYPRMLRPFIVGAVLLSLLYWFASQYWVPKANEIRTNFQATYIDRNSSYNSDPYRTNNFYLRVNAGTYVGLKYYDTARKTASSFFLSKVKNDKIYYNLRAESIRWDTAKKDWLLTGIVEHTNDGLKETARLIPTMHMNLNVRPEELRRDEYLKDKYTTPELKRFIKMEELRGSEGLNTYKEERYHRDASPFSVIILTIIGAVIATRKIRGGSGLNLAIGLVMAAVFVIMDKFSVTFATKGNFSPMLAAWMPNIIFGIVAGWLYWRAPK
ncbi:MAG: LptF/LptG family permease [Bacteroidota bacterium]|nr:LptF/LptG family permease [Bacteroidota bacterium]MDP4249831.1 LptF/LptG family permease [Bacteroidota bacterium]